MKTALCKRLAAARLGFDLLIHVMVASVSYSLKYAPLTRYLEQGSDLDWLKNEGHEPAIIEHFLEVDQRLLISYTAALKSDFHELYGLAIQAALQDVYLAKRLIETKEALDQIVRFAKRKRRTELFRRFFKTDDLKQTISQELKLLLQHMQHLKLYVEQLGAAT